MSAETASGASADIHTGWTTRLRRVPVTLLFAWTVVFIVLAWAALPQLFTGYSGTEGVPGNSSARPAPSMCWAPTGSAATSMRASSTARAIRCPALSWPSRSACCSAPCSA